MKLLRLAISDIISFAKEKTMVFVLLVVGMVLSCFCAVYYYSYQKTISQNWKQHVEYYIEFDSPVGSSVVKDLLMILEGVENSPYIPYGLELLDQNSYDSMDYISTKSSRSMPEEYIKDDDFKYTYPRGIIGFNDYSFPKESMILKGRELTDKDELINGVLGDAGCKPGDIITLYEHDFEVVGTMKYNYGSKHPIYVIIPSTQYIDLNLPCKYIMIDFERTPPQKLIDALSTEANKIDPGVKLFEPEYLPESVVKSLSDEMFKIIIIVSLSIIYIFALFRYWIVDNFKKYAVFTITGASLKILQLIVIIGAVFFVVVPYILSIAIFYMLDIFIGLLDITYSPLIYEYLLIALLLSAIAVIITLPTIWLLRKTSLHNLVQ